MSKQPLYATDIKEIKSREELVTMFTPLISKHLAKLTEWFIQWPIVLGDLIFNKLLRFIGRNIVKPFNYIFKHIAKMLVRRAIGEMLQPEIVLSGNGEPIEINVRRKQ